MLSNQYHLPDFSPYGYQAVRSLGHSAGGGRATYLVEKISSPYSYSEGVAFPGTRQRTRVVIKKFSMSLADEWSGDKAVAREIEALKKLNHPGIPRYLCDFEMGNERCLVQEYIDAPDLATVAIHTPEQIKQIALQLLDILHYIHAEKVFHRDIKPENILLDSRGRVYLVDFGIAHLGIDELSNTSRMSGTIGFNAPESLFKNQITASSDLFSLGVTLICLLTKTPSENVMTRLWNIKGRGRVYEVHYRHLLKAVFAPLEITEALYEWLDTLIQYAPEDRFPSAKSAAQSLKKIQHLYNIPSLQLLHPIEGGIELNRVRIGEKCRATIKIRNTAQDTTLRGEWSVKYHPNDAYEWIIVESADTDSDIHWCNLLIDTRRLMRRESFERVVVFQSNAKQQYIEVPIIITTDDYLFAKVGFIDILKILSITLLAAFDAYVFSAFV